MSMLILKNVCVTHHQLNADLTAAPTSLIPPSLCLNLYAGTQKVITYLLALISNLTSYLHKSKSSQIHTCVVQILVHLSY